jgi:hypothetical protein
MGIRQGVSGKYRRSLGAGAKSPKIRGPGRREAATPDRTTSGQRVVNCLVRIGGSKGAASEDEIVSGHAIDYELALLARVEGQPFEDSNQILLIFMLSDRKLGSGALRLVTGLSAPAITWNSPLRNLPVRLAHCLCCRLD